MTIGGWITFILSTGSVCALFVWCMYKVVSSGRAEKISFDVDAGHSDNPKKRSFPEE